MQLTYLLDGRKPKSFLWFYSEEKRFFHKSNYIHQKGIKIHMKMK